DLPDLILPIMGPRAWAIGVDAGDKPRRREQPPDEIFILVVPQLFGADRCKARYENDGLTLRKLHHFARRQQRPGGLLPADHDVPEPGRKPMARIVALRP